MKKDKPVILIDMDDTLCDLVGYCINQYNAKYPTHQTTFESFTRWDAHKSLHPDSTEAEFFMTPGTFENLSLLDEYVVEEMKKLHEAYEVIIITAAFPQTVLEKWNWLQKHLPFIPLENFFTGKKKYLLDGDLLIDDAPHNLKPFVMTGRPVIGIPRPWNESLWDSMYFKKDGWKGMKEKVDDILRERGII